MKNYYLLLLFVIPILSCSDKGEEEIGATTYEVDPIFEPYVQEFIAEGAKRGQAIDFSDTGLKVEFSETALDFASGFCYLRRHHIVINKENWFSFSERFRSFLLFHELGHCELDQGHRNELFGNNVWKSLMRGDPFTGIEPRIPTAYFGFRKEYYIDELFNPTIAAPAWSRVQYEYDQSIDRTLLIEKSEVNRISERFSNPPSSYELEATFILPTANNNRTRFEWGTTNFHYYIYVINGWGYYIGVHEEQLDNNLYYSNNTTLVNNKPIEKITIRQHDGVEQIFINDLFIFHIDALPKLDYSRLEATDGGVFVNSFEVESFVFSELK